MNDFDAQKKLEQFDKVTIKTSQSMGHTYDKDKHQYHIKRASKRTELYKKYISAR